MAWEFGMRETGSPLTPLRPTLYDFDDEVEPQTPENKEVAETDSKIAFIFKVVIFAVVLVACYFIVKTLYTHDIISQGPVHNITELFQQKVTPG